MKNVIKMIIAFKLALISRIVLKRYKPHVVMVTGSVGKTSTKDAVAAVLASRFFVRKSQKNFNNEWGVPLTILGISAPPGKNIFAWFTLIRRTLGLLFLPNHYPNLLVLEVGADRPGDLAHILKIATPNAVVVTRLPEVPVHVEAYASPDAVREEEFSPAHALAAAAPLIIFADDPYAVENAVRTPARVLSYGRENDADVVIGDISFYEEGGVVQGMRVPATVAGEKTEIVVTGAVGAAQVLPAAAALATAVAFGIPLDEAKEALAAYEPPAGRGRLLAGKNGSVIIDDSYNASPVAVENALSTLHDCPGAKRRIAVLGDMLELGRYSVEEHARIGALARASADEVIAVGVRARAFEKAPGKAPVHTFETAEAAAADLVERVEKGDVILVKGSQSIRTERIVKALLANPEDAALLVRQESRWQIR